MKDCNLLVPKVRPSDLKTKYFITMYYKISRIQSNRPEINSVINNQDLKNFNNDKHAHFENSLLLITGIPKKTIILTALRISSKTRDISVN